MNLYWHNTEFFFTFVSFHVHFCILSGVMPLWNLLGPVGDMYCCFSNTYSMLVYSISDMGDMNDIWGFLRLAFATGFENGEIKSLIRSVCSHVIKQMDSVRLIVESPPPNSLLVSRVLPVDENEFEEEGSSLESDTYPIESEKRGGVVPDVIVYHPTLPLFLLSVECKRACDDDNRGIVQCLHQLLSHMHHQSLHFGFWINPHKWRLMVVHKNEENHTISVMQEEESLLIRSSCNTFNAFNVDSLLRLFKWIHKALVFECSRIAK